MESLMCKACLAMTIVSNFTLFCSCIFRTHYHLFKTPNLVIAVSNKFSSSLKHFFLTFQTFCLHAFIYLSLLHCFLDNCLKHFRSCLPTDHPCGDHHKSCPRTHEKLTKYFMVCCSEMSFLYIFPGTGVDIADTGSIVSRYVRRSL